MIGSASYSGKESKMPNYLDEMIAEFDARYDAQYEAFSATWADAVMFEESNHGEVYGPFLPHKEISF